MSNDLSTSSGINDVTLSLIDNQIVVVFREKNLMLPFVHQRSLEGLPSLSISIPKLSTTLTMNSITTGANEADAIDSQAITTGTVTLTAASKSAYVTLSDLIRDSSTVDLVGLIASQLGLTMAADVETALCALLGGHSGTVGTSGVDLTAADFRAAMTAFRLSALEHAERGVAMLHPQQVADLVADLSSGVGAGLAQVYSRQDVVSLFGGGAGESLFGSYAGHYMNCPIFQSANVPTANAGADRAGAIFVPVDAQNSPNCAYGWVWKWMPGTASADLLVNRQNASVHRGRFAAGSGELNDGLGISIITDA